MAKKAQSSLQCSDGFTVTPSDTGSIVNDVANTNGYTFIYIHNYGTSGAVRVSLVDMPTTEYVTLYVAAGQTLPFQIRKVWASGLGSGVTLTAGVGRGGVF